MDWITFLLMESGLSLQDAVDITNEFRKLKFHVDVDKKEDVKPQEQKWFIHDPRPGKEVIACLEDGTITKAICVKNAQEDCCWLFADDFMKIHENVKGWIHIPGEE